MTLTPGTSYVAFFSSSNVFDGTTDTATFGINTSDVYSVGQSVWLNSGNDFSLLTSNTWSTGFDLAFEMTFVPAPGALGLLMVAGLCGGKRRRRA